MDDVELYTCKAVRVSRILLHLHITQISLVTAASITAVSSIELAPCA